MVMQYWGNMCDGNLTLHVAALAFIAVCFIYFLTVEEAQFLNGTFIIVGVLYSS